jgi:uncharacterized protein YndB with AHSA1/START domain
MTPSTVREDRRQRRGTSTIRAAHHYDVPAARVFNAWLDPEIVRRWLFATASRPLARVEIDARVDGRFSLVDRRRVDVTRYSGEYVEIAPPMRLVFTLCIEPSSRVDTRVSVDIVAAAAGCRLRLTHENVPADDAEDLEGRWAGILYGLAVTLDAALALQSDQE